jgi:hypothetical protein
LSADRAAVRVPERVELVVLAGSSTMAVDIPENDLGWRVDGGDALRDELTWPAAYRRWRSSEHRGAPGRTRSSRWTLRK